MIDTGAGHGFAEAAVLNEVLFELAGLVQQLKDR
jgi:hypothetical protein